MWQEVIIDYIHENSSFGDKMFGTKEKENNLFAIWTTLLTENIDILFSYKRPQQGKLIHGCSSAKRLQP